MEKAFFLSVAAAKQFFGVTTLRIVKNEKNGKISILLPTDEFVRVQQDLDKSKPMAFMTTALDGDGEPDWFESCLVNVSGDTPIKDFDTL